MKKATRAQVKQVREFLRKKSARDGSGVFVAEGVKIVREILRRDTVVREVFISGRSIGAPSSRELVDLSAGGRADVYRVPAPEFEKLSSLKSSQGVLAVVEKPAVPDIMKRMDEVSFAVLCDGVQDPGNLGAIIRSCVAFGADLVLLYGDSADAYNPKVVRASSGTVMDIPVARCDIQLLEKIKGAGAGFYASVCDEDGAVPLGNVEKMSGPVVVIFGSEGAGVSGGLLDLADLRFTVPVDKKAQSLNVTAAAAVSLYELTRI
jgi:TrmH family RNA methyltransferase